MIICLIPCSTLLFGIGEVPTALSWSLLAIILFDHLGQHGDGGIEPSGFSVAAVPGAGASFSLGGAQSHPVLCLCEELSHGVGWHRCDLCWWENLVGVQNYVALAILDISGFWIFRMLCPSSLGCLCRLCVESAGSYNPVCVGVIVLSLAATDTQSVTRRVSRHHGVMARGCMMVSYHDKTEQGIRIRLMILMKAWTTLN